MCGIAGLISISANDNGLDTTSVIEKMLQTIAHRGPDDSGYWISENGKVVLGHRRLSVIDLSEDGHQPMLSACGQYVIVYNGEVYNFVELRKKLESFGHKFRGHSDTEVVLAAITQWGLEEAVKQFNGMFAFALWDRRLECLHLVRDRIGVKPLYYGWIKDSFVFGSELKVLRSYPGFSGEVCRDTLAVYASYNYIPAPYSIYKNIYKLIPGSILTIPYKFGKSAVVPKKYWSALEFASADPLNISTNEAIDHLEKLLLNSIKLRMVADVPLGVFLSGGIDSSLVCALMQLQSDQAIRTFSIGFNSTKYNEAHFAKKIADYLHTDHYELYLSEQEAINIIPNLPNIYDEPFADSSQIPTFLVSKLARSKVTVSLSGDGGDELFCGYNRYLWSSNIWSKIKYCPLIIRNLFVSALLKIRPSAWDAVFSFFSSVLPKKFLVSLPGDKIHKLAGILNVSGVDEMYNALISSWSDPKKLVNFSSDALISELKPLALPSISNNVSQMMFWDLIRYLPDDILVKVDRASMSVGLEAREPLLDYRIVEFAQRLPLSFKIKNNQSKWILRQILYKYLPKSLLDRPKMGFGVPIGSWLRGDLREWAEELMNEKRLQKECYFNSSLIRKCWQDHLGGKRNFQSQLWNILMFQAWLEKNG